MRTKHPVTITIERTGLFIYRVPGIGGTETQVRRAIDKESAIELAHEIWGDDVDLRFISTLASFDDPDVRPTKLKDVKIGEFIRRKADAKKTFTRGEFCRRDFPVAGRYECNDVDDISRSIYLKGSTIVFVGFTY